MVDAFMEKGFCYFDTAYGYLNGKSEEAVKTALVDRYPRDQFLLATKLPAWAGAKTKEEAQRMFDISLERTARVILTFIFCTTWGRSGPIFLTTMISGTFLPERKKRD